MYTLTSIIDNMKENKIADARMGIKNYVKNLIQTNEEWDFSTMQRQLFQELILEKTINNTENPFHIHPFNKDWFVKDKYVFHRKSNPFTPFTNNGYIMGLRDTFENVSKQKYEESSNLNVVLNSLNKHATITTNQQINPDNFFDRIMEDMDSGASSIFKTLFSILPIGKNGNRARGILESLSPSGQKGQCSLAYKTLGLEIKAANTSLNWHYDDGDVIGPVKCYICEQPLMAGGFWEPRAWNEMDCEHKLPFIRGITDWSLFFSKKTWTHSSNRNKLLHEFLTSFEYGPCCRECNVKKSSLNSSTSSERNIILNHLYTGDKFKGKTLDKKNAIKNNMKKNLKEEFELFNLAESLPIVGNTISITQNDREAYKLYKYLFIYSPRIIESICKIFKVGNGIDFRDVFKKSLLKILKYETTQLKNLKTQKTNKIKTLKDYNTTLKSIPKQITELKNNITYDNSRLSSDNSERMTKLGKQIEQKQLVLNELISKKNEVNSFIGNISEDVKNITDNYKKSISDNKTLKDKIPDFLKIMTSTPKICSDTITFFRDIANFTNKQFTAYISNIPVIGGYKKSKKSKKSMSGGGNKFSINTGVNADTKIIFNPNPDFFSEELGSYLQFLFTEESGNTDVHTKIDNILEKIMNNILETTLDDSEGGIYIYDEIRTEITNNDEYNVDTTNDVDVDSVYNIMKDNYRRAMIAITALSTDINENNKLYGELQKQPIRLNLQKQPIRLNLQKQHTMLPLDVAQQQHYRRSGSQIATPRYTRGDKLARHPSSGHEVSDLDVSDFDDKYDGSDEHSIVGRNRKRTDSNADSDHDIGKTVVSERSTKRPRKVGNAWGITTEEGGNRKKRTKKHRKKKKKTRYKKLRLKKKKRKTKQKRKRRKYTRYKKKTRRSRTYHKKRRRRKKRRNKSL